MTGTAYPHAPWRTSSHTGKDECVEVADIPGAVAEPAVVVVLVRDTKDRAAGHLTVDPRAWTVFLRQAAATV